MEWLHRVGTHSRGAVEDEETVWTIEVVRLLPKTEQKVDFIVPLIIFDVMSTIQF